MEKLNIYRWSISLVLFWSACLPKETATSVGSQAIKETLPKIIDHVLKKHVYQTIYGSENPISSAGFMISLSGGIGVQKIDYLFVDGNFRVKHLHLEFFLGNTTLKTHEREHVSREDGSVFSIKVYKKWINPIPKKKAQIISLRISQLLWGLYTPREQQPCSIMDAKKYHLQAKVYFQGEARSKMIGFQLCGKSDERSLAYDKIIRELIQILNP